jgi:hypothetical protein
MLYVLGRDRAYGPTPRRLGPPATADDMIEGRFALACMQPIPVI